MAQCSSSLVALQYAALLGAIRDTVAELVFAEGTAIEAAPVRWSGNFRWSNSGGLVRLETGLRAPVQRIDALEVLAPRPE